MKRTVIAIILCVLCFIKTEAQEAVSKQHQYVFKDSIAKSLIIGGTEDQSWFRVLPNKGLEIQLQPATIMGYKDPVLIGKPIAQGKTVIISEMEFYPKDGNETAGLILYQTKDQFYYLCKSKFEKYDVMQLYKASPDSQFMDLIIQKHIKKKGKIQIKIAIENNTYSFYFSENKEEWKPVREKVNGQVFPYKKTDASAKTIVGIYVSSNGQASTNQAYFKYLDYLTDIL